MELEDFKKFTPEQDKIIKLTFNFTSDPQLFKIECGEDIVGTKEI